MESLGQPLVMGCYFEKTFQPPISAMRLRWDSTSATAERNWRLPRGLTLNGPAPDRFGMTVLRRQADTYFLRLLWNDQYLQWNNVNRRQILTSCLTPLLRVLGTDVWELLEQPVEGELAQPAA